MGALSVGVVLAPGVVEVSAAPEALPVLLVPPEVAVPATPPLPLEDVVEDEVTALAMEAGRPVEAAAELTGPRSVAMISGA